jgi:N-acetylglucosaminyldiphosphoundecaprenol N-acetyl-beta-D-mannosaminyltransferase
MMNFLAPFRKTRPTPAVTVAPVSEGSPAVVKLRGVRFHAVTEVQCVNWIMGELAGGRGGWLLTANLDHLRRLVKDGEYGALCEGATMVVADGMPVVWAARVQGTPLPARVAGSDLVNSLSEAAARAGRSVYLLGGDPGTAEEAAAVLAQKFPGFRLAGAMCPEVGFERDAARVKEIEDAIVASKADVVYVALGSPKQEKLIAALRQRLPGAWWIGVGISFSFLCGRVRRAPRWLQRVGLEWLHRLAQEPSRLAGRYLRYGVPFALSLFGVVLWNRLRRISHLHLKPTA